MRRLLFAFVAVAACARVGYAEVIAGFEEKRFGEMGYRLFKPAGHDSGKSFPLVITLHGAGEKDDSGTAAISRSADLPLLFGSAQVQAKHPAFVMAPGCSVGRWVEWDWDKGSYELSKVPISTCMQRLMAALTNVMATYKIDSDRIYVAGVSMGGFGTWDILLRNPQMFAGAIPVCGGASPKDAASIAHIPVWTFHAVGDGVVPSRGSREMFAALVAAGGSPTYTEYDSDSHISWVWAAANPGLADWLFAQRRGGPHGGSPTPDLVFTPPSGPIPPGTAVSLSSALLAAKLFAATNVADPLKVTTPYVASVPVAGKTIVAALAETAAVGDLPKRSVYHAATFSPAAPQVDAGAPVGGAGGTGGTGGISGNGGVGGGQAGQGGSMGGQSGGGNEDDDAAPAKKSSGCSYSAQGNASPVWLLLMAGFLLVARARAQRKPVSHRLSSV